MNRLAANIAAVLAMGFVLAYVGPRMDEVQATASDAISAQKAAQQRARFERAAQAMCGENAGWRELDDGRIACFTKRGHKTMVAKL